LGRQKERSAVRVEERVDRVATKLRSAARRDVRPFGAEAHRFRLLPPVADLEIRTFEARYGISLPAEYRAFLMRVGRGGAGPAYGLIDFNEAAHYEREDLPDDIVGSTFSLTEPYNPYDDPALAKYWEREGRGEASREDHDGRSAAKARELAGTLVLCHEGCGHLHLLVVNGPVSGQMWFDSTASDGGYGPLGVTFLDWYERWLDDALAGGDGIWWARSG
jgi:hypothetical protein